MFNRITVTIAALAMATSTLAHMEMTSPPPLKSSKHPKANYQNIDYSMTQPLGDYPCKGYINAPDASMDSVATWSAGSSATYSIGGTATHRGGSCQLAMSYDMGKTWNVILSYMGGCMVDERTTEFTIPKEAPSGEALFAWSWFNQAGNREMYQNCAVITVTNGGSGLSAPDYPAPFVANVAAAPGCTTIEGVDVVFPNPGKNVKYGGSYAQSKPTAVAGISGDCANAVGPQPAQPSAPAQSPSPSPAAPSKASAAAPSSSPSTSTAQAATNGHETLLAGSDIVTSTAKAPQPTSTALSGGHCKKRKRSNGTMARRHERLAAKALKRGGKRVAALPASYNVAAGL